VLGVDSTSLSPPELISAILGAPADLIWFGGIGTFIKAPEESDVDVADHANDGVRITSEKVRARVIAEGANLGVTQRARIRYSRRGGRINADFIDNAAGVATSDREVNLKILLALAIEEGRLDSSQRDAYLAGAQSEVAEEVLRQVDHSVAALNRATVGSARELDAYESLLDSLESAHRFDRTVEYLPGPDELAIRRAAGAGLARPELAVLLAYAKSDLVIALERSPLVNDAGFIDAVVPYFPSAIRREFGDLIPRHRLYPQLVATDVAGEIVDQLGIVWAHETAAELARGIDEVAAAFWAARRVTGAGPAWAVLEQHAATMPADTEALLHAAIKMAVAGVARAYLVRPRPVDISAIVARDQPVASRLSTMAGIGDGPGGVLRATWSRL
jgi:glutamate dehydrogenase